MSNTENEGKSLFKKLITVLISIGVVAGAIVSINQLWNIFFSEEGIPNYEKVITSGMDNRQEFREFIDSHKGKIVHIKMEIRDNQFIDISLEGQGSILLYEDNHEKCESNDFFHSCAYEDVYEIEGADCDINFRKDLRWMDCYLLIPQTGGNMDRGVRTMRLKSIPSETVLLK